VGRHRVRRMMREQALNVRWRRKHVHTTDSRHSLPVAKNVLNRQFTPEASNRAWASADAMPADLVCTALQRTIALAATAVWPHRP